MTNLKTEKALKKHREPVLYESLPYIIPLALLFLVLLLTGRTYTSLLPLLIALFIAYFFRNPERKISQEKGIIVSPADGRVILIQNGFEEESLKDKVLKISIFLSIFNVHVNRAPCAGEVLELKYKKGKFLVAFKDAASSENEQLSMLIDYNNYKILVKQIAGIIARRIVCWALVGNNLDRGQRYGLIRFGSRVDIFLPDKTEVKVKLGDRVKGGETILGVLK